VVVYSGTLKRLIYPIQDYLTSLGTSITVVLSVLQTFDPFMSTYPVDFPSLVEDSLVPSPSPMEVEVRRHRSYTWNILRAMPGGIAWKMYYYIMICGGVTVIDMLNEFFGNLYSVGAKIAAANPDYVQPKWAGWTALQLINYMLHPNNIYNGIQDLTFDPEDDWVSLDDPRLGKTLRLSHLNTAELVVKDHYRYPGGVLEIKIPPHLANNASNFEDFNTNVEHCVNALWTVNGFLTPLYETVHDNESLKRQILAIKIYLDSLKQSIKVVKSVVALFPNWEFDRDEPIILPETMRRFTPILKNPRKINAEVSRVAVPINQALVSFASRIDYS